MTTHLSIGSITFSEHDDFFIPQVRHLAPITAQDIATFKGRRFWMTDEEARRQIESQRKKDKTTYAMRGALHGDNLAACHNNRIGTYRGRHPVFLRAGSGTHNHVVIPYLCMQIAVPKTVTTFRDLYRYLAKRFPAR